MKANEDYPNPSKYSSDGSGHFTFVSKFEEHKKEEKSFYRRLKYRLEGRRANEQNAHRMGA